MKRLAAILSFFVSALWALPAKAVCPVCTVAVAGGVGLSRYFGIDDTITGVWIGALLASLTAWTMNWLEKKNIKFFGDTVVIALAYYAITLAPLYWSELAGHPFNILWGVDKLALGVLFGSILFVLTEIFYEFLKKKNNGHAHFPFEKVILPIVILAALSAVFYFLIP
ncbi:MAG: hypothetical protein PHD72_03580 [Patescibacteria group bacterium]|nr:hypothetical protein [Patescibacteria group bacterium]